MLYHEYEPEILARLQKIELEMLIDFDKFCSENDIDYFGCYGTVLGAVRHGGFIPWDDDIDVGMTRENYDKFLKLSSKLPDKYFVMSHANVSNFPLMTAWMVLKGSRFKVLKEPRLDDGIYLDIFCFENVYDDEKRRKRQMRKGWFWGKLHILWYIKEPVIYHYGLKAGIIRRCLIIAHHILRTFVRNPEILYQKAYKYASLLKDEKTGKIAVMFDPTPFTSLLDRSDVEPTKRLPFEGVMIKFPAHPESYLKCRYGNDYMVLPPEDKRHNHPPYELKFPDENS